MYLRKAMKAAHCAAFVVPWAIQESGRNTRNPYSNERRECICHKAAIIIAIKEHNWQLYCTQFEGPLQPNHPKGANQ